MIARKAIGSLSAALLSPSRGDLDVSKLVVRRGGDGGASRVRGGRRSAAHRLFYCPGSLPGAAIDPQRDQPRRGQDRARQVLPDDREEQAERVALFHRGRWRQPRAPLGGGRLRRACRLRRWVKPAAGGRDRRRRRRRPTARRLRSFGQLAAGLLRNETRKSGMRYPDAEPLRRHAFHAAWPLATAEAQRLLRRPAGIEPRGQEWRLGSAPGA